MNLEEIKKLVKLFKNVNYKDLFGALVLNEKIDYLQDIEDISNFDIEYLEELYKKFMDNDEISLLSDNILELIEED